MTEKETEYGPSDQEYGDLGQTLNDRSPSLVVWARQVLEAMENWQLEKLIEIHTQRGNPISPDLVEIATAKGIDVAAIIDQLTMFDND